VALGEQEAYQDLSAVPEAREAYQDLSAAQAARAGEQDLSVARAAQEGYQAQREHQALLYQGVYLDWANDVHTPHCLEQKMKTVKPKRDGRMVLTWL
jgi:hypothetical protein